MRGFLSRADKRGMLTVAPALGPFRRERERQQEQDAPDREGDQPEHVEVLPQFDRLGPRRHVPPLPFRHLFGGRLGRGGFSPFSGREGRVHRRGGGAFEVEQRVEKGVGSRGHRVRPAVLLPMPPRRDSKPEIARTRFPPFLERLSPDLAPLEPQRAEQQTRHEGEEDPEHGIGGAVPGGTLALEEGAEWGADPGRDEPRQGNGRSDQAAVRQRRRVCFFFRARLEFSAEFSSETRMDVDSPATMICCASWIPCPPNADKARAKTYTLTSVAPAVIRYPSEYSAAAKQTPSARPNTSSTLVIGGLPTA